MKRSIILTTLIITFLYSCSVEKRVHMRGYHVEFRKNNTSIPKKSSDLATSLVDSLNLSSYGNGKLDVNLPKINDTVSNSINCDTIILRNSEKKLVKVIDTAGDVIKFKACESDNTVAEQIHKRKVSQVVYANNVLNNKKSNSLVVDETQIKAEKK